MMCSGRCFEIRRLAWACALLSMTLASACRETSARDPAGLDAPPVGDVVGGFIVRDDATRLDIATTATVALPRHDVETSPLSLIVTKSRYRLDVLRRGESIKTYPVALGGAPSGAKEVEGDSRTPEGRYLLFPHHPSPSFGSSFYVAYPGEHDAGRGVEQGVIDTAQQERIRIALERAERPPRATGLGGLILIHGTRKRWLPALTRRNWTTGCIALENDDLIELLAAFDSADRPVVEIRP